MLRSRGFTFNSVLALSCITLASVVGCASDSQHRSEAMDQELTQDDTSSDTAQTAAQRAEAEGRERQDGLLQQLLPDSPVGVTETPAPTGTTRSSMAFPTGNVNTSAVLVEKFIPSRLNVGEEFEYTVIVRNISDLTLDNVELTDEFSTGFDMSSSSPRPSSSRDAMVWDLGTMQPGDARTITVVGSAESTGSLSSCGNVTFDSSVCIVTEVVEPALRLAKTATSRVGQCDVITYTYTVTNSGSGTATNVTISDTLPRGITTQGGESRVSIPVGALVAGQSREFTVLANASRTGEFGSQAVATGSPNLEAESGEPETVVVKPELSIAIECTENQYIGRNATYTISVENDGDGVANGGRLVATLPAGTTFVSASNGGTLNGNQVVWNLGAINAGGTVSGNVVVTASAAGSKTLSATVTAACAEAATDNCTTTYRGIPAILLEVVDVVDPVEVGTETTYIITATNQGSAPGTNVEIVCELPDSMAYVSATGTTNVAHRSGTLTMSPVTTLGVGQQAVWRVTIRATDEEDARFSVSMTSDQLTRPVAETEATNLYR